MRLQRHRSQFTFRSRTRRRAGCLPFTLIVGIIVGALLASWDWLGERLNLVTPPQTSADLRAASRAFDDGDLDSAIEITRQLWAAQPDQVEALTLLVRTLVYRSYHDYNHNTDREVALQFTASALSQQPEDPDVLAIHAFALQASGLPVEATHYARAVLNRQPEHVPARVALALAYARIGSHDLALREGQIAAENAGDWQLDALRAVALSLNNLGRYHEAAAAVEEAIEINNRLLALHFERALYGIQIGDTDAATAAYFRALAFDPDNVKARLRMCELSSLLRERTRAVDYCLQVTQRAPTWADGWYRLGREYYLQGDFSAAQSALNRCSTLLIVQNVPISQRQFECWYLQGQAAEILGDCDNLLATYNEFRTMAETASLPQTWTYPPEGPSICLDDDEAEAEADESPENLKT
jgi:tetratricopeptide (TPR) repeat protein